MSPASVCYSLSNKYLSYIHMKLGEMSPSYPLRKLIHSFFFFFQFSLISVLCHKKTPFFFFFFCVPLSLWFYTDLNSILYISVEGRTHLFELCIEPSQWIISRCYTVKKPQGIETPTLKISILSWLPSLSLKMESMLFFF